MGHTYEIMASFVPLGRFVPWDVLSLGTFCLWDVLSLATFCPCGVLSLGRFVLGCFVLGRFVCAYFQLEVFLYTVCTSSQLTIKLLGSGLFSPSQTSMFELKTWALDSRLSVFFVVFTL